MAERFMAAVLKTAVGKPTVGSNPTPSAMPISDVASLSFFQPEKEGGFAGRREWEGVSSSGTFKGDAGHGFPD